MSDQPVGKSIPCPVCATTTHAIVPAESTIVPEEEHYDGKVWVNCHTCGDRFLVYYESKK